MLSKNDAKLITVLTVFSAILLPPLPSLAGTQYISKDGNLTVQYDNQCSTTKPSATYRVRNGVTGNLTALDCSNTGGDVYDYKFEDTSGKERCYGQMRHVWSRKVVTIWTIEGAIPGYPCSQAGKTFTVETDSGKRI